MQTVKLTPEIIKAIEEIINSGERAEIGVVKEQLFVWSKKEKSKVYIKLPIA